MSVKGSNNQVIFVNHRGMRLEFDAVTTVGELRCQLTAATKIAAEDQTLIHRGKKLTDDAEVLPAGSKLMLVAGATGGRRGAAALSTRPDEHSDQHLAQLAKIERTRAEVDRAVSTLREEFVRLHRGFLDAEQSKQVFERILKRLHGCDDRYLRCLEALDAIETHHDAVRARRKADVRDCQEQMRHCDLLKEEIQTAIRDEHGELAHRRG